MSLFNRALNFIKRLFKKPLNDAALSDVQVTPEEVEHAITIVNRLKSAAASPFAILATDLIPTTIDNRIRETLVAELPVIAAGLTYLKSALSSSQKEDVLKMALVRIRFSDDADKDAFYHALAARLLSVITGGRVKWSDAVMVVEYAFRALVKSQILTEPN